MPASKGFAPPITFGADPVSGTPHRPDRGAVTVTTDVEGAAVLDDALGLVVGSTGDDTLLGGSGDDTLQGRGGVDTLNGGSGNDTADYSDAAGGVDARLNRGQAGNDGDGASDVFISIENLTGSAFNDLLIGDNGANVLTGGLGADTLLGLGGNDILIGGSGAANTLQGGLGDDTYVVDANDTVTEFSGEGTDTVQTSRTTYLLRDHFEHLQYTGSSAFQGTGNAADNSLAGGSGDDTLQGRGGVDTLNGGSGSDTADYSAAAGAVDARLNRGQAGNDGDGASDVFLSIENLTGSAFNDLLVGDGGSNVLNGGLGADVLIGLGGNDILIGGAGAANELSGGLGDDTYVVDANDTVTEFSGEGTDTIQTSRTTYGLKDHFENLQFTGSAAFRGTGNAADNSLEGGSGSDVLIGRGGNDRLDGNAGIDTADYSAVAAGVTADLGRGTASSDGDGGSDTLSEIENLIGSALGDSLTGDGVANVLNGGAGDDVLAGRGGHDVLNGGAGIDTLDYSGAAAGVTVELARNSAGNDGDGGSDSFSSIENLIGSAFNDVMVGDGLANVINGGLGGDVLLGLGGDDTLIGGAGAANELYGGLGDDTYVVSANDTIVERAGEGSDSVVTDRAAYALAANLENLIYTGTGAFTGRGNAGANLISGADGNDTLTGGGGDDILVGGGGSGDTVVMSGALADYTVIGLSGGIYRILDTVRDRDGADTVNGVELIRFADGQTVSLASLVAGPAAPLLADKGTEGPQVLPGVGDDDFLPLAKGADLPTVLPLAEAFDLQPSGVALLPPDPGHMLTVGAADTPLDGFEGLGGRHDPDGWLF